MFNVVLSNKDSIFDSATFHTLEAAIKFASGRGDVYVVQIGRDDHPGVSLSYNSDNDQFSSYDGLEWHPVSMESIRGMI